MKIIQKHSYLLYWICDDKRFEIRKNLYCKSFYLIFRNVNVYVEEINGNQNLTLVLTKESKTKTKKYEEM